MLNEIEQRTIEKIIKSEFDLAETLFVFSGINNDEELQQYQSKLEQFVDDALKFIGENKNDHYKAFFLSEFLSVVDRPMYGENVKLTEVLDSQLGLLEGKIGSCTGLSYLYTVMAEKLGLNVKLLFSDRGTSNSHVSNIVYTDEGPIHIENTDIRNSGSKKIPEGETKDKKYAIYSILHTLGCNNAEQNNFDIALKYFDIGVKLFKDEPEILFCRANAYKDSGNFDLAIHDYFNVINNFSDNNPFFVRAHRLLGDAYFKSRDYGKAMELYTKGIELNDEIAYAGRANLKLALEDYESALDDLNNGVNNNLGSVTLLAMRANLNFSLGNIEQSEKDAKHFLKVNPTYQGMINLLKKINEGN